MNSYIPCPNCGWQEILGNFDKYGKDEMTYKLRCMKCGWLGSVSFLVQVKTEREGRHA